MINKKDGFQGERSVVLPPVLVERQENDALTSSLFVTDIGFYPLAEHHHRIRHQAIDQYVLIYCVEGSGYYVLDGKRHEVRKNQYFILPAGKPHEYGTTEGDQWTIYWLHFRGNHCHKTSTSPSTRASRSASTSSKRYSQPSTGAPTWRTCAMPRACCTTFWLRCDTCSSSAAPTIAAVGGAR